MTAGLRRNIRYPAHPLACSTHLTGYHARSPQPRARMGDRYAAHGYYARGTAERIVCANHVMYHTPKSQLRGSSPPSLQRASSHSWPRASPVTTSRIMYPQPWCEMFSDPVTHRGLQ